MPQRRTPRPVEVAAVPSETVAQTEEVPQNPAEAEVPEIEIVEETASGGCRCVGRSRPLGRVGIPARRDEGTCARQWLRLPWLHLTCGHLRRRRLRCRIWWSWKKSPRMCRRKRYRSEPLVAAYEDTGHEEFHVPVEAVDPEDWTAPIADVPAEPHVHAQETTPVEEEIEQHAEALLPEEEPTALPIPEHAEVAAEGHEPALEEPQAALPEAPPPQPEIELDQEFELVLEPEEVIPAHEMLSQLPPAKTPEPVKDAVPAESKEEKVAEPVPSHTFSSDQFLSDLAREIDELGLDELTPALSKPSEPVQEAAAEPAKETVAASTESGPLKEVFDEFRAELGEMGAEDEDLETHYNLGIAFREMGLLEEAIGEFQKVAKANDRGKAFRYAMQCSTLLGLAFMEKGQPDIAAIWYERALTTPGLDSESKLALRYDLGVAQESAGDLEAALKSFSQVYAVNIDYRDVAERIASLQKPAR